MSLFFLRFDAAAAAAAADISSLPLFIVYAPMPPIFAADAAAFLSPPISFFRLRRRHALPIDDISFWSRLFSPCHFAAFRFTLSMPLFARFLCCADDAAAMMRDASSPLSFAMAAR